MVSALSKGIAMRMDRHDAFAKDGYISIFVWASRDAPAKSIRAICETLAYFTPRGWEYPVSIVMTAAARDCCDETTLRRNREFERLKKAPPGPPQANAPGPTRFRTVTG
jgi:hypothetical protein